MLPLIGVLSVLIAEGATIRAASCSLSAVQSAVNSASDGDIVTVPNGSCAWSGGISTSKQIRVEAQNYTSTKGGTMTRSVPITNNSNSGPLLSFTSGSTYHVGVSGIRFNEGSGNQNHVRVSGSGSKVPLINDCAFQVKSRFGNQPDIALLAILSQGGVVWNSYFQSTQGFPGIEGASILVNSPRSWQTASTMGSLDTNGAVNVYIEDSTLENIGQAPDVDDDGRFVMRYSTLDGSWGITHGFTSKSGGRHFEYYNNTFNADGERNMAGRYFWIRAGTGIFTDNVVNAASSPRQYGNAALFEIGDNTSPGSYPMPRQPGWGHNGSKNVIDPIYAWNNTGAQAAAWGYNSQPGGWQNIVREGREVFVNAGAKPGYSKFTYPHPARAAVEDTAPKPRAPTNVTVN